MQIYYFHVLFLYARLNNSYRYWQYIMNDLKTHIDTQGKILIPARLRKLMQFKPHDTLILRYTNEELVVLKQTDVIKQIQADFKRRSNSSKPAVEELLEMRQSDRDLENARDNDSV